MYLFGCNKIQDEPEKEGNYARIIYQRVDHNDYLD